jgi:hypothetical protein
MKASFRVGPHDFQNIVWFLTHGPGSGCRGAGFVVHLGDRLISFAPGRFALIAALVLPILLTARGGVAANAWRWGEKSL